MTDRPKPPLNVLIIEDEALLVMDLEAMIEDAGHRVIGDAASVRELQSLKMPAAPDLALIDMQLAEGSNGLDACAYVRSHWSNAIIVFVTANPKKIPDDYAGAHGVIPKPFSRAGVTSAIHYLEQGICRPPPTGEAPGSFVEAPGFAKTWA